jgi:hypothetical protein
VPGLTVMLRLVHAGNETFMIVGVGHSTLRRHSILLCLGYKPLTVTLWACAAASSAQQGYLHQMHSAAVSSFTFCKVIAVVLALCDVLQACRPVSCQHC